MSKRKELAKNTAIIALGKLSTQFMALLLVPVYTAVIAPSEYGFFDLALTYISLLAPIITLQYEMAAFRFLVDVRQDKKKTKQVISNIIITNVRTIFLTLILALLIGFFVDIRHYWFIIIATVVTSFSNILLQIARGQGKNNIFSKASIVIGSANLTFSLIFILPLNMGVPGLFLGMILANMIGILYLSKALNIHSQISLKLYDKSLQKKYMSYSLPFVPNWLALWIVNSSSRTIVVIMLGAASNGLFAIAGKLALILTSLGSIFNLSWTESASIHLKKKDGPKFISQTLNDIINLFLGVGLVLITASPVIFNFFINSRYNEALKLVPPLVISAFFATLMSLFGGIYVAMKRSKILAVTSAIVAVGNVLLTIVMIKLTGILGAALASGISFLILSIYRYININKSVRMLIDWIMVGRYFSAYAIVCPVFYSEDTFLQSILLILSVLFVAFSNAKNIIPIIKRNYLGNRGD